MILTTIIVHNRPENNIELIVMNDYTGCPRKRWGLAFGLKEPEIYIKLKLH